jgi:hypothetical protein
MSRPASELKHREQATENHDGSRRGAEKGREIMSQASVDVPTGSLRPGYAVAEQRPWERYVGIAGIAFLVLISVSGAFFAVRIKADEPAAEVVSTLMGHRAGAVADAYLLLAALVPLLVFTAGIITILGRNDSTSWFLPATALGAALTAIALLGVAQGVMGALAGYIVHGSNPEAVRVAYGIYDGVTTASDLFLGVFVLTASILAFVVRALPPWVRWIGILSGACLMVGAGALTTPYGGVGPLIVVGFVAFVLWVASTSVLTVLGRVSARK